MSEPTKNEIIDKIYNDRGGFGSVRTTYKQIKARDERLKTNSQITLKDVKNWFFNNVEDISKPTGYNSFVNDAAYEEYQMDHIFFGRDEEKNLALTMIDTFSKFAVVIPMKGKTGPNVLAAIMEGIQKMGKKPKMLYCDRDTTFTGPLLEEYCKDNNIKLIFTHTHPPVVERFNRTFKSMTWKRLKADKTGKKTWMDYIFDVVTVYNATEHTSTGMTPIQAKEAKNTLQVKVNLELRRHKTRTYPDIHVGDKVKIFYKNH